MVRRDDLRQTRWEHTAPAGLEDGAVRLRIDKVVLYDDVASSLPDDPAVYVDLSGSAPVYAALLDGTVAASEGHILSV